MLKYGSIIAYTTIPKYMQSYLLTLRDYFYLHVK